MAADTTTSAADIAARTTSVFRMMVLSERGGQRRTAQGCGADDLPDQHGGGDDRGPETCLVSDGRLRAGLRGDDLTRPAIGFFRRRPARVRVVFEARRSGEPL